MSMGSSSFRAQSVTRSSLPPAPETNTRECPESVSTMTCTLSYVRNAEELTSPKGSLKFTIENAWSDFLFKIVILKVILYQIIVDFLRSN